MATRAKAAGYHGCEGVKFAPKETEGYGTPVALPYAKGINPSALLDAVEQYADNRLLFRIPSDKGYEGEFSTTAPDAEFEKMAGGQENLVKENGGAGRLATPQEMADPLLFLNSDMAAFVSGLLLIADMGHNCEKTLGFCNNQLDVPAALKLYNTKFFQNKLKTKQ